MLFMIDKTSTLSIQNTNKVSENGRNTCQVYVMSYFHVHFRLANNKNPATYISRHREPHTRK